MNVFTNQANVERMISFCPEYQSTILSPFILSTMFFPEFITASTFALAIVYPQDIYLLFVSFMMMLNFPLNYGLQLVIGDAPRFVGCYDKFGAPSFAFQHLLLLDTLVMTYPWIYNQPMRIKPLLVSRALLQFAAFSWVYIGANTVSEILIGAGVGVAFGLIAQAFVYYALQPYANTILHFWLPRKLNVVNVFLPPYFYGDSDITVTKDVTK